MLYPLSYEGGGRRVLWRGIAPRRLLVVES
jgi:hypothetical protein